MINLQSVLNVLSLMLNHSGWMLVMQVAWPSVWFRSAAISPSPYFRTHHIFPCERFQTFPPPWTFDQERYDFNDDHDDDDDCKKVDVCETLHFPVVRNPLVCGRTPLTSLFVGHDHQHIGHDHQHCPTMIICWSTSLRSPAPWYRWENEWRDHQRIPRTRVDLASLGKLPKISSRIIQPRTIVKKKGLAVSTWPSSPIQHNQLSHPDMSRHLLMIAT